MPSVRSSPRDISNWLTASELSAKVGFRSADPDAGPKGWKAAGKIFSLKVDGEDLYPDYVLDEKMRPLKVVRLILSLFKERKTPWGLAIWFGSANRRLRGGKPKDLLVSKSELVLMAAQDEVESGELGDIDLFLMLSCLCRGRHF